MKRKSFVLVCLVTLALLAGCSGNLPTVCDKMTDSVLCDLSRQYDVRIEDVGNALIIANAIAIGEGVYSREHALRIMTEIRAVLDNPISYALFRKEVNSKMEKYPGLILVASSYFAAFESMQQTIYPSDRQLIIGWLDQQIKILGA